MAKATQTNTLAKALGHSFRDQALLGLALTHSSHAHEKGEGRSTGSNERMEFLGDSVLGLVITHHLYESFPGSPEGRLSAMKSRLVSGPVLGKVAKNLDLGKYLLLGKGEEKLGGRQRRSILARALEGVLGALYLDGGLAPCKRLILKLLDTEIQDIQKAMKRYDYKSQLQKVTQSNFGSIPAYELVSQTGPDHGRVFRVRAKVRDKLFAEARGSSKKSAEQRAARLALRSLEQEKGRD